MGSVPVEGGGGATVMLWLSAGVSLALLVLAGAVAEVVMSRGRDIRTRLAKTLLFTLVPMLALIPALLVGSGVEGPGAGAGLLIHVVLFACFCYHLGKRIGYARGRRHLSDLVGLDGPDDIADAQDRLFESRMRFPSREKVIVSIGEMARARKAEQEAKERDDAGHPSDVVAVHAEEIRTKRGKR